MTGRTHDLAALTTLTVFVVAQPLIPMTLGTVAFSIGANIVGAIVPDLDQPTARLWRRAVAGEIVGKIVGPLLGNHRMFSHSLAGLALIGWLVKVVLTYAHGFILVDMNIVWGAFMLGYISHLLADTITKEGVPWFFPVPVRFGFPPIKLLRIETGGIIEKIIIYPGLFILNGYLIFMNYQKVIDFIFHYIRR